MVAYTSLPSLDRFAERAICALGASLGLIILTACAHHSAKPAGRTTLLSPTTSISESPPIAHYSRYTLVEMAPDASQIDLLQQVVDVRVPATEANSVGDTIRYVLLHSGYRLCDEPAIRDLEGFPLPAAHMHLGPLPLGSVLQLLAGRAWDLQLDEENRRICFSRSEIPEPTNAATPPVKASGNFATVGDRK